MDGSSVVWKYVRPVDSVRTAVAHQGQDQGLELQGQGQDQHNIPEKDRVDAACRLTVSHGTSLSSPQTTERAQSINSSNRRNFGDRNARLNIFGINKRLALGCKPTIVLLQRVAGHQLSSDESYLPQLYTNM